MTAAKPNTKSKALSIIGLSVFVLMNVIRVATHMNHQPVATQTITPDEISRITGHPITSDLEHPGSSDAQATDTR